MYEPEYNDESVYDEALLVQDQINTLVAWRFEGSVGRHMMEFIEAGYCVLGRESTSDYYGNRIPSRKEVKAGTMGSYQFVKQQHGKGWADMVNRRKAKRPLEVFARVVNAS